MNKERLILEVTNVVDALKVRGLINLGIISTLENDLVINEVEKENEKFFIRITDNSEEITVAIDTENQELKNSIEKDVKEIEIYLNRVFYLV